MNFYSLPPLITSILVLSFGFFVYSENKSKALNKIFFFLCFSSFIWLFSYSIGYGYKNEKIAFLWLKIGYSGVVFISITTFHYFVEFLKVKKIKNFVLLNYIAGVIYVILIWSSSSLIDGVSLFFWGFYPHAGPLHPFFLIHFLSLISFSFILSLYFFFFRKKIFTQTEILRIKYIFLAFFIYNFASIDFLPNYKIEVYPFGFLPSFIFSITIGYSILRYRLMDIKLIFKKTMAYSLSAGLLTAFFAILVLTITNLLSTIIHVSSFTISIFAVLLIALLFNPIRNRIQKLIDKVFYKKTYDYIETVNKVSHDLVSILDIKKIFNSVGDIIFSTMGLKSIYLLAISPSEDYEVVYSMEYGGGKKGRQQTTEHRVQTTDDRPQDGTKSDEKIRLYTPFQKEDSPDFHPLAKVMTRRGGEGEFEREIQMKISHGSDLVRLLKTSNDVVIKDELPGIVEVIKQETIDNISSAMKPFNGEVVAPVFIDDKLSLLIVLGGKLSGDIFTNEDVNLLRTVSNQTAIAIKNASLYAEKLRSERFASIGMMSATFAHEIRNPLTSIKTFAQLFPEKYMDTDFREVFSKVVVDDIERIDGLIRDLMDFSSIGKALSYIDDVDVVSLIDEILSYLEGKLGLENKKISVEKIYKDVKINILGDSEKLKQAFINIITNGCQAMGENGVLKVNITPKGREVDIAISDTGKGISQEEISRLFDPFYTTKPMGMGLGLAISKKIIEDHGGRIIVESKISKGTTFTVSLPGKNQGT